MANLVSSKKIKSLKKLRSLVEKLKAENKKIVLGHGVFDLLHYGHIYYLEQAKDLGDILIVSVVINKFIKKGPKRPVFNEKTRANSIAALSCVDYIVLCRDFGPWKILEEVKPDIYVKGEDSKYQLKDLNSGLNKDKKIVESCGGVLYFTKSLPIHSTSIFEKRK